MEAQGVCVGSSVLHAMPNSSGWTVGMSTALRGDHEMFPQERGPIMDNRITIFTKRGEQAAPAPLKKKVSTRTVSGLSSQWQGKGSYF